MTAGFSIQLYVYFFLSAYPVGEIILKKIVAARFHCRTYNYKEKFEMAKSVFEDQYLCMF